MKKLIPLLLLASLTGCYTVSGNKSILIDPNTKPVMVQANAKATCRDFILFYSCSMDITLESSDGKKAEGKF